MVWLLQPGVPMYQLKLGKLHPSGSPCPTDEWTLCLFATFLARTLLHSSIKVYFSGIRALHINQGFPDPLAEGGSRHQALPGHSFFHTAAYYRQLVSGYMAVFGSRPSRPSDVLGNLFSGILLLPARIIVHSAQSLYLLCFPSSEHSGRCSGLLLGAVIYAYQDQGFQDGSIPERLLHSHWPWSASSVCDSGHDVLSCHKGNFSWPLVSVYN